MSLDLNYTHFMFRIQYLKEISS